MALSKLYSRTNWKNYPSDATPLNENNLNKLEVAVDEIDNRVIGLDATKLDKMTGATMVKDVSYDPGTGIFTVTYLNGARYDLDTKLEKLAVNFAYDAAAQQLTITLDDGTKQHVDLSALITQYEFLDTDTVDLVIDGTGKVSAAVKDASIQERHLRPDYLADIRVESAKAQASRKDAATSASAAKTSETSAKVSETNARASASGAAAFADKAEKEAGKAAVSASSAAMSADTATAKAAEAEKVSDKAANLVTEVEEKLETGHFNGAAGQQGPPGPQGEQGPEGEQGAMGPCGATGPQGVQGLKGDTGPAGKDGQKGDTGPPGPQGSTGATGPPGATGATGPQGIQGSKGDKGDKGDRGDSGMTVPVGGFFTLYVDVKGDLYACSADGSPIPDFEYDSATGNMYFVTEV